jgi:hypothetical protein
MFLLSIGVSEIVYQAKVGTKFLQFFLIFQLLLFGKVLAQREKEILIAQETHLIPSVHHGAFDPYAPLAHIGRGLPLTTGSYNTPSYNPYG